MLAGAGHYTQEKLTDTYLIMAEADTTQLCTCTAFYRMCAAAATTTATTAARSSSPGAEPTLETNTVPTKATIRIFSFGYSNFSAE